MGKEMGISRRTAELAVAIGLFLVGITIIADSIHLGIGWLANTPQPGYFPVRVGGVLAFASVVIAVKAYLDRSPVAMRQFVSWPRFRLVLAVFLPTVAYTALIFMIGIYVASALYIAAFMIASRKFRWPVTLAVSLGTAAVAFWLFEMEFLVPLPKGPLEALFGY
jgi:hypothetical protein